MRVRDLRSRLLAMGCTPLRIKGSHEIWRTPGRQRFSIVVNHLGRDASRIVLSNVARLLREEGLTLQR